MKSTTQDLLYSDDYWSEYVDESGNKYYYHTPSGETAWEVPPDAMVWDESKQSLVSTEQFQASRLTAITDGEEKQGAVHETKASNSWTEVLDKDSGQVYYYNETTGESSWEKPTEMQVVAVSEDDFTIDFAVPKVVNRLDAEKGAHVIWDRIADYEGEGKVSPMQRINVLEPVTEPEPFRQRFTWNEPDEVDWLTAMTFYAFSESMPYSDELLVEGNPAPLRTRLSMPRVSFPRDITRWRALKGESFHAYPQRYQGAAEYHVDWSSGPDRYMISQEELPRMGWKRQYQFYAYGASKYHVLQCLEPATYKVVKGHYIDAEPGWKCIFGFYAFDDPVPGTNLYYVQEQNEPFYRIRLGLEKSVHWGWQDCFTFYAFDVPIHGTSKISVHYTIRSTDSEDIYPERHRLTLGLPSGIWEHLLDFYSFPATSVQLKI